MDNKAPMLIRVPIFAVSFLAVKIRMLNVRHCSEMIRVYATLIFAFMVDFLSVWNWSNEKFIRPPMGAYGLISSSESPVSKPVTMACPKPATSSFIKQEKSRKAINGWLSHFFQPTGFFNPWNIYDHFENPSRSAKVIRAHDEPQSQSETVKWMSCFCGRIKAFPTLIPTSA